MKIHSIANSLLLIFFFLLQSFQMDIQSVQHPADPSLLIDVIQVPAFSAGESQSFTGNINTGIVLNSLDWAASGGVACFPGTRFVEFQGNQVFYQVTIPKRTELLVSLRPTGDKQRINVYGYLHFNGQNVPPIERCISCEAGYPIYAGKPNLRDAGGERKISFSQAINRSYTALVVVSGAKDVLEGDYELTFELK